MAGADEKLHKVLARAGYGSRREIERWIAAGRVTVDGIRAQLGARVQPSWDRIAVDGRRLQIAAPGRGEATVLVYHKPTGEICTRHDPGRRATVFDRLPALAGGRWVAVGRLDLNTSGLLLFTDDGALANRLMHPRYAVEREYACRVLGAVSEAMLARLTRGVRLDGRIARFESIRPHPGDGANRWFDVVLAEGRYREVRRLWEAAGCRVSRLIRTRYGPVRLPRDLPAGLWRALRPAELRELQRATEG